MQARVDKVFRALCKRGMTRAFVEAGRKEYIYPAIVNRRTGRRKLYGLLLLLVFMIIAGTLVYVNVNGREFKPNAAGVTIADRYGMTLLHHAAAEGNIVKVTQCLANGGDIDKQDSYGWTPLHWAAFSGNRRIYRMLVENGAVENIGAEKAWFKYPKGITPGEIMSSRQ